MTDRKNSLQNKGKGKKEVYITGRTGEKITAMLCMCLITGLLCGCEIGDYIPALSQTKNANSEQAMGTQEVDITQESAEQTTNLENGTSNSASDNLNGGSEAATQNEANDVAGGEATNITQEEAQIGAEKEAEELLKSVRILNNTPDDQAGWEALAKEYTKQTGTTVNVLATTEDVYERVNQELNEKERPATILLYNSANEVEEIADQLAELSESELYQEILSDDFVVSTRRGSVQAVAINTSFYGLIYNKTLLNTYASLNDALITEIAQIDSFKMLSLVATDMQARKGEIKKKSGLPFEGAFTSAGMDASTKWRFDRLLLNYALFYEKQDGLGVFSKEIKGKYLEQYQKVLDLQLENATCPRSELSEKSGGSAIKEIATGEAAFYFGGSYNLESILGSGKLDATQFGMMPLFFGVHDKEEGLGLLNTKYVCVNSLAKERDRQEALAFLSWCIHSKEGQEIMTEQLRYTLPYTSVDFSEQKNTLTEAAIKLASDRRMVLECYELVPSKKWEDALGNAIASYATGEKEWDEVEKAFSED